MTTLVANRQPLQVISMSNQPDRQRNKRPAAAADFDQDGDFVFKRKKAGDPTAEPAAKKKRGRPPAQGRAAKATLGSDGSTSGTTTTTTATATRATRTARTTRTNEPSRSIASPDASNEQATLKVPKRATRRSVRTAPDADDDVDTISAPLRSQGHGEAKTSRPRRDSTGSFIHEPAAPVKITLPMSDTPIINRNKEMRRKGNGGRRSSLGSRGRRASSLIESGETAIPHREVNPSEFYKHIESEGLPEPRRMRQLLTWCGERALSEKPPHGNPNANAIRYARAIQDQLLKDFASQSEFSDWFSRDDSAAESAAILKPNPRNIELDQKMATLEAKVQRLQQEKKAWLAIRKPPPEQPPLFISEGADELMLPDFDLLDADEGKIRGYLANEMKSFQTVRSETEKQLRRIQSSLEFEVDQFSDNIHKLEQRVSVAGKDAEVILRLSAVRLREREERERASAGTENMPIMEVLRSLSSILPEGER